MPEPDTDLEPAADERDVVVWRYQQARQQGLNRLEARLFAESDGDLGQLRRLRRDGCPAVLAAKIVL